MPGLPAAGLGCWGWPAAATAGDAAAREAPTAARADRCRAGSGHHHDVVVVQALHDLGLLIVGHADLYRLHLRARWRHHLDVRLTALAAHGARWHHNHVRLAVDGDLDAGGQAAREGHVVRDLDRDGD